MSTFFKDSVPAKYIEKSHELEKVIHEQMSLNKNFILKNDNTYQVSLYGFELSFDCRNDKNRLTIEASYKFTTKTYFVIAGHIFASLFFTLLFNPLYLGIGLCFILGFIANNFHFSRAIKNGKEQFLNVYKEAATVPKSADRINDLKRLNELMVDGIITKDEFESEKKKILSAA